MTSPFNTPAMHRLKKQVFLAQAEALAQTGPKPTPRPQPGDQPTVERVAPATGKPFATEEMAQLRRRARRRPDLGSLPVWNGNEGPTLDQLAAGDDIAGLIADMERNR